MKETFIIIAYIAVMTGIILFINDQGRKSQQSFREQIISAAEQDIRRNMVWAYYQGQKEFAEGDERISKTDSGWVVVKSAWNKDTSKPYVPILLSRIHQ